MAFTIEAIYEGGVLKPTEPLPFAEHQKVQLTIHPQPPASLSAAYGIIGWKGDHETLERFAMDPELDFPPPKEAP